MKLGDLLNPEQAAIDTLKSLFSEYELDLPCTDSLEVLRMAVKALETVAEMKKRNISTETILEYAKFEDECVQKGFTFKSLLEAREKQIPKKPTSISKVRDNEGYIGLIGKCPCCDEILEEDTVYCDCGQKLDWGD